MMQDKLNIWGKRISLLWVIEISSVTVSVFFFFSSRRRHTRWNCDWSSDVCFRSRQAQRSPAQPRVGVVRPFAQEFIENGLRGCEGMTELQGLRVQPAELGPGARQAGLRFEQRLGEIGRASCRERGEDAGDGGSGT